MTIPPPGTLLVLAAVAAGAAAWVVLFIPRSRKNGRTGSGLLSVGERVPVAAWAAAAGAGVWALATAAGLTAAWAGLPPLAAGLLRAGLLAAGAVAAYAAAVKQKTWPSPDVRTLRDGAVLSLLVFPPTAAAFALTAATRTAEGANPLLGILIDAGPGVWAAVVFSAVVLAPIGEELLFRGLFQGALRAAGWPAAVAVALTAALFAAVHPPQDWPSLFVLACVLGWGRERTGSVLPAVLAHAAFNGLMLAYVLLNGPASFAPT